MTSNTQADDNGSKLRWIRVIDEMSNDEDQINTTALHWTNFQLK